MNGQYSRVREWAEFVGEDIAREFDEERVDLDARD